MKIIRSIKELKTEVKNISKTHAFVPTMGALHNGHIRLIKTAKQKAKYVSVSIFVNPTQFNKSDDLKKYPQNLDKDLEILKELNVDLVFLPTYKEIYPDDYRYKVSESDFSKILCGKDRPGHFDGVLTIVMKLFLLLKPDIAVFGKKDFQQYQLIKDMTAAFFLDTQVIGIETVREQDGLALSSRNLRLSRAERIKAKLIPKLLKSNKKEEEIKALLQEEGFDVDYVSLYNKRRFIAASINNIRLIDNHEVCDGE